MVEAKSTVTDSNHNALVTFLDNAQGRIRIHGMRAPAYVPLDSERRLEFR